MRFARVIVASIALVAPTISSCGSASIEGDAKTATVEYAPSSGLPGAVRVAFTIPRAGRKQASFFDLPWPSELRRDRGGKPIFTDYPGRDATIFEDYVAAAELDVDGFSIAPVIYLRFEGLEGAPAKAPAMDERPRPDARAQVMLVDVDPKSPERGAFHPVTTHVFRDGLKYVPSGVVAIAPAAGAVLRPGTLYAAVMRREPLIQGGSEIGTSLDGELVKWTKPRADPDEERARATHAAALDEIGRLGVARASIAAIALFRTHVPHAITAALPRVIDELPKQLAPRVLTVTRATQHDTASYEVLTGSYCTPNFQTKLELAPFLTDEGGSFHADVRGAPIPTEVPPGPYHAAECGGMLRARFVLSVPRSPAPHGGYPLLVTAHGTGGDAFTFLGDRDFAGWAAKLGAAAISTDQPLHGGRGGACARPGSCSPIAISIAGIPVAIPGSSRAEVAFYNPLYPRTARDNLRQAAADGMTLARLFGGLDLATVQGAPALSSGAHARFDRSRIFLAGHSQGSQSMAAQGAVDPLVKGVLLSGSGGDVRLGILRRKDLAIVPVIAALWGVAPDELTPFHPMMSLIQTLADPIDPATYGKLYRDTSRPVLHVAGRGDTYTPEVTADALATAIGASPIDDARGLRLLFAKSGAPRAYAKLTPTHGENGHFVLYYEAEGDALVTAFFSKVLGVDR